MLLPVFFHLSPSWNCKLMGAHQILTNEYLAYYRLNTIPNSIGGCASLVEVWLSISLVHLFFDFFLCIIIWTLHNIWNIHHLKFYCSVKSRSYILLHIYDYLVWCRLIFPVIFWLNCRIRLASWRIWRSICLKFLWHNVYLPLLTCNSASVTRKMLNLTSRTVICSEVSFPKHE